MKKLVTMLVALTIFATVSIGHAETRVDSPKIKPGTIFLPDDSLEKIQRYGF